MINISKCYLRYIIMKLIIINFIFINSYDIGVCKLPAYRPLQPGFVRGDLVSYSYVPNKTWTIEESFGKLPYLWEYGLMKFEGDTPLETFHDENIRRIDMASKWSTVIHLYAREMEFKNEIINLMIRAYKYKQLFIISDYPEPKKHSKTDYFANTAAILDHLWINRNKTLKNPEGDIATGRQLVNNILAIKIGDEGLHIYKTEGLYDFNHMFREKIKFRSFNGIYPFKHIKSWYNEMHYGFSAFAATQKDLQKGKMLWPSNSEIIGVDTYHYLSVDTTPFDPDDPNVDREQVKKQARDWQNVITKYYGPDFKVEPGSGWYPRYANDTHAILQSIELSGIKNPMMFYIANSNYSQGNYTTPTEIMDAFYESIKEGPWIGLSWWVFDWPNMKTNTIGYLDGTIVHYTKNDPKGVSYTQKELDKHRENLIASRMRMFNDVVYNQFGYLNKHE